MEQEELVIERKLAKIVKLVDLVNAHWVRLDGDLFNDRDFWDQTLHSLSNQDWQDMVDGMKWIRLTAPDRFNYAVNKVLEDVERILVLKGHQPRVLDSRRYKKTEFLALMWIKDVINDIRDYTPPRSQPKPTQFELLFKRI